MFKLYKFPYCDRMTINCWHFYNRLLKSPAFEREGSIPNPKSDVSIKLQNIGDIFIVTEMVFGVYI